MLILRIFAFVQKLFASFICKLKVPFPWLVCHSLGFAGIRAQRKDLGVSSLFEKWSLWGGVSQKRVCFLYSCFNQEGLNLPGSLRSMQNASQNYPSKEWKARTFILSPPLAEGCPRVVNTSSHFWTTHKLRAWWPWRRPCDKKLEDARYELEVRCCPQESELTQNCPP